MASAPGAGGGNEEGWRSNIVTSTDDAIGIAAAATTVAVLGIKTERFEGQPAFDVARVLQRDGCRIIPVPVYYPDVTQILGEDVVRDLSKVPAAAAAGAGAGAAGAAAWRGRVDILDVFRRPQDVPSHVADIVAMDPPPACVWLQSGCGNAEAEEALARGGVRVVSNRCLMVDRRAAAAKGGGGGGGGSKL